MARKRYTPPKVTPWAALLQAFDSRYFHYGDGERQPENVEDAAYDVATYFFDNTKTSTLKKIMSKLPEELWVLALKNWRDHHHDT